MARRAWGEGSYIHVVPLNCKACPERDTCVKRGNNSVRCSKRDRKERWLYQYRVVGADGKYIRKALSATNRKDLVRKVEEMREASGNSHSEAITLQEWADIWPDKYLSHSVRPSTEKFYRSLLKHIPEKLGRKKLVDITVIDWQDFLNALLEHGGQSGCGLSTKTVRSVRTTLISCIESAVDNGFLTKNLVKKTKSPKLKQKKIIFLTKEQAMRLQKVADSGEYYKDLLTAWQNIGTRYLITEFGILIRLTLASGLRRGELFGLLWDDVDFDNRLIHVVNNMQHGNLVETKTQNSVRCVSLDDGTINRLRKWKDYQERYADEVGDIFLNENGLVFTNIVGNSVNVDTFRSRYFTRMCKTAELPEGTTLHSLRHTHASMLLAAGVSPKVISSRLGHASVAFTLQVYAHINADMERGAADTIGSILGPQGSN